MKTASVIDLRNNFASVSRWIYEGESVTIQKRGRPFAILSPVVKTKKEPLDWPDFTARLERQFPNGPTKGSAEEIVDHMRGEY
jgi:antitoxin (DNA-binding transcriptional repressor) of toxin-antitoxin stability system